MGAIRCQNIPSALDRFYILTVVGSGFDCLSVWSLLMVDCQNNSFPCVCVLLCIVPSRPKKDLEWNVQRCPGACLFHHSSPIHWVWLHLALVRPEKQGFRRLQWSWIALATNEHQNPLLNLLSSCSSGWAIFILWMKAVVGMEACFGGCGKEHST